MSELWVAVIAAGSAVAGAAVGGWFARSAGIRQAEAAKHAGDRQADAMLRTVQDTLIEQRRSRTEERRRQIYTRFLEAAEDMSRDPSNHDFYTAMHRANTQVHIEGPRSLERAAHELADRARNSDGSERNARRLAEAHLAYTHAVREALGIEPEGPAPALPSSST